MYLGYFGHVSIGDYIVSKNLGAYTVVLTLFSYLPTLKGTMKRHLLLFIPMIFIITGQTFSKYGALEIGKTNNIINIYIILGYTMLILRGFVWVFILKKVKLSFAYPLMSVTYIIILAISYLLFNEDITFYNLLGCCLIIGGVTFVSLGEIRDEADLNG